MFFDPCDKCIVKAMCRDKCGKKIVYANKFDSVTSAAAFIFVVGSYIGLIVWVVVN